ncbi:MAG: hypothetical protein ACT4O5_03460 [Gammaproteobacteria bacterium]
MSADEQSQTEFERRTRELLEESVTRADARVRSRLTRARYAAVEEAARSRSSFWHTLATSSRGFAPAGALAAAVLVVMLVWTDGTEQRVPVAESQTAFEDVELLADAEALDLMEEWEEGFYEWAAGQDESPEASG